MSIAIENVTFRYPGGTAVGPIDLSIGEGELLAVIGASGSGKTTLLKLVAGFLQPTQGRIRLGGVDVTGRPPRERALGIVFQSYALFPHMSLRDNVAYALKVRGVGAAERARRAQDMLERVGLGPLAARRPVTLSGGQQQRVALARALAFEPRGLLLDEPLSALDASLRVQMRDEIRRLQQEQRIATLHITHDQEEALSMADRVAIMADGRLLQVATPRELYDRPASRRVAAFVGHANLWPAEIVSATELRTGFGSLACAPHGLASGSKVTVLVRPERIRPVATGGADTATNRFAGRILRDRFLGAVRRVDIALGDSVILLETAGRDPFDAIHIPPEQVQLLTD